MSLGNYEVYGVIGTYVGPGGGPAVLMAQWIASVFPDVEMRKHATREMHMSAQELPDACRRLANWGDSNVAINMDPKLRLIELRPRPEYKQLEALWRDHLLLDPHCVYDEVTGLLAGERYFQSRGVRYTGTTTSMRTFYG